MNPATNVVSDRLVHNHTASSRPIAGATRYFTVPAAVRSFEQLERQVQGSVALGARVLCGGHRIEGPGHFFAPTVLTDVTAAMPVVAEETFGPVAALIIVSDDDDAVAIANDTEYGLAASVWSRDTDHALAVGRRIRSGALFVNSFVSSDPRVPFGGIKRSGYGRELGAAGVREFTNVRTFWVAPQAV
jgi:succinate-semialdehyde dehydrogenase/glutarate-semialdehyde dehydrogenase